MSFPTMPGGCPSDTGRRGLEVLPDGRIVRYWAGGETLLCPPRGIVDRVVMGLISIGHALHYRGPARPDTVRRYAKV